MFENIDFESVQYEQYLIDQEELEYRKAQLIEKEYSDQEEIEYLEEQLMENQYYNFEDCMFK